MMSTIEAPSSELHILLVEDNEDHAYLLKHAVSETWENASCLHLNSGISAIEYLHDSDTPLPDLILLDLKMPGLSGFDVLTTIKVHRQWRRIPVVILTTSFEADDRNRAYDGYANSYVVKPIEPSGFRRLIGEMRQYWSGLNQPSGDKPMRRPSPHWGT